MTGNITIRLASVAAAAAVFVMPFALPALGLDQIVKLYICQTEHEIILINGWSVSDPERYRVATKDMTISPVDAAMDRAAFAVSTDRIICDDSNRVAVLKSGGGSTGLPAVMAPLEGAELEAYCPATIKKNGPPCE